MDKNRFDTVRRRAAQSEISHERRPSGDQHRHAGVLRSLRGLPSRRDVLHGLAGVGLGLATLPHLAEAKPRRRKKRKRPKPAKPNRYGCLEVNDPCRRHTQCCSGICTGKPGKKRCRAHGTGTCRQDKPGGCMATPDDGPFLLCNSRNDCLCFQTTAGSNFCTGAAIADVCEDCRKDADCLALGYPPGSACAPVGQGHCTGVCDSGMACLAPCGAVPPAPTP